MYFYVLDEDGDYVDKALTQEDAREAARELQKDPDYADAEFEIVKYVPQVLEKISACHE